MAGFISLHVKIKCTIITLNIMVTLLQCAFNHLFFSLSFSIFSGAPRPTKKCVAGNPSTFPGGFFYLNQWSSSFCQTLPFLSKDNIPRCLKGKTLHLLGDSTVNQWFGNLCSKLNGNDLVNPKGKMQKHVCTLVDDWNQQYICCCDTSSSAANRYNV